MIIDSSALIAILLGEPEAELFTLAIARTPRRMASAFTALETAIVIEAKKGDLGGGMSLTFLCTGRKSKSCL